MNAMVYEWVEKAEGDYYSALREYRARKRPNYDAAGFHAQQCIEKYLKALLQSNNMTILKIHDLLALQRQCSSILPELELYKEHLAFLSRFAILYRYPGESATQEMAKQAITALKELRAILRQSLRLSNT